MTSAKVPREETIIMKEMKIENPSPERIVQTLLVILFVHSVAEVSADN